MKQLTLYFLLICLALPAAAQDAFKKGNEFYQKERYSDAARQYEAELAKGVHSAELYFNLANAYYKLDKVAPAVYYYEKALMLDPHDRDIRINLGYAHNMMIDEVKEVPRAGFGKLVHDFTGLFHYDTWGWIAVSLSVLVLLLFAGYYLSPVALHKRILFFSMLAAFILTITSAASGIYERDRVNNERPAIVFAEVAQVKGEPRLASPDVIAIHEGTKVYVLEELGEWKKVLLPDGNDGWIKSSAIKEIK